MNIASGTEVSHYRIVRPIGRGGMSEVYLALDLALDRHVAMKFIETLSGADPDSSRPLLEAHLAAVQDHPAPVKIYEVGRYRDMPFIVMEYVEGKSLADLLEESTRLPLNRTLDIAIQLCWGLAATHEHGIMHGDIKPANIKVDRHGRVRVLDFGVARAFSRPEDRPRDEHSGTIPYMAPELLHGGPAGAYSDLFAVGVLLYRMLSGRLPFDGAYDAEIVYAITNKTPGPLSLAAPHVPPKLAAIVHRLLEKVPQRRYQAAAQVAGELAAVSAASRRSTPKARLIRLALVLGVALLAVAAASWYLGNHRGQGDFSDGRVPVIAVLPFDNLGAAGDEYFSDGVTDAVTTLLAQSSNCRVISRHSSMLYKKTTKSLPEVALELGADFLVSGSIHWRRTGSDSVWITLAVVEPVTDAYAWTREYADRVDRIFAIQSDMARDLAHALAPGNTRRDLPKVTEQPTASLRAYDFLLRGNEYFNRSWERSDIETARQLYERALIADSNFALALAMLARCDASMFWERYDPSERRRQWAFDEANRALALAPDLAEAHLALGYCYYHGERDFDRALAQFQKGLARDPNHSDLWNAVAAVHRRQGQIASAVAEFEQSLELDPRSHLKAFDVGLTLGMMRRFGEAEHYLERTTHLAPDYALAWLYRIWLPILDKGDTARARAILNSAMMTTDLSRSKYYWILCRILPPSEAGLDAPTGSKSDPVSYYLYLARRARLAADRFAERSYSDSARILLERTVLSDPSDAHAHSELGIALAGLGVRSGALAHGQKALALLPESREAFDAPFLILNMAEIYVVSGALDEAVDQLEQLLRIPGFASREYLKLDFVWTPLASHPQFRRLLQSPDLSSATDRP